GASPGRSPVLRPSPRRSSKITSATRCPSSRATTTPTWNRSPSNSVKVMSMAEAVERFIPDGASIAMGVGLEPLIPFAAGHELIRRQRRDLELVGPISDALFDQLIGAGCV